MQHEPFNIPVEEFTTPNPLVAEEDASIEKLMDMMSQNGVRHLPIVRNGKPVGIISDRDLRVALGLTTQQRNQFTAKDIMATDPVGVYCHERLDAVAFKMAQEKIGSVIVLDEKEELMGIFTVTDALNALIEITRGDDL